MSTIDQQINSINRQLNRLAQGLKEDIAHNKKLKKKASKILITTMRANAPEGETGNLKRSIKFLPFSKSQDVFIGPSAKIAPHAHLVEFGFTHYKDGKRKAVQPFVKQSYEATKGVILSNLTAEAKKEFEKWGKRLETTAITP